MISFDPLADPCFSCGLWRGALNPCIRPKTYKEGGIVFIGESPGEHEDQPRTTLVGRGRKSFKESLDSINTTEYTILSAVRCRPTDKGGNRTPTKREVDLCNSFLQADLSLLRPACIICLGATAARAMQLPSIPLKDLRHRRFYCVIDPKIALVEAPEGPRIDPGLQGATPVWVTYHPEAYRRPGKSNLLHEMQQDLARYLAEYQASQMPPYPETAMDEQGAVYFPNLLSEYRTLTDPKEHAILNLEGEESSIYNNIYNNKAPTGPIYNILTLDIETTGFLKGYKALPFDKGDILLIGYDKGDGYESNGK